MGMMIHRHKSLNTKEVLLNKSADAPKVVTEKLEKVVKSTKSKK